MQDDWRQNEENLGYLYKGPGKGRNRVAEAQVHASRCATAATQMRRGLETACICLCTPQPIFRYMSSKTTNQPMATSAISIQPSADHMSVGVTNLCNGHSSDMAQISRGHRSAAVAACRLVPQGRPTCHPNTHRRLPADEPTPPTHLDFPHILLDLLYDSLHRIQPRIDVPDIRLNVAEHLRGWKQHMCTADRDPRAVGGVRPAGQQRASRFGRQASLWLMRCSPGRGSAAWSLRRSGPTKPTRGPRRSGAACRAWPVGCQPASQRGGSGSGPASERSVQPPASRPVILRQGLSEEEENEE